MEGNLVRLCRKHHNMAHNGLIPRNILIKYLYQGSDEPILWITGNKD